MAGELNNPVIADALLILGSAGVVIPLFARLRITPVVGFLLVGLLVGPHGLGRLVVGHDILGHLALAQRAGRDHFARFGAILLLFSGGLELSLERLRHLRHQVFGLGALELLANSALLTLGLVLAGQGIGGALALGIALAMSSTALVPRITRAGTPVGRAALAMVLFEDIALVPVIVVLDALNPRGSGPNSGHFLDTLLLGTLAILLLLVLGRALLPRLFAQAARTKSPELFLATSLLVVIVAAMATAGAGLSPWAGAMIAGLLIAETEYHGEVDSMTQPFKGLALGIFLIAVGMGVNLDAALAHPWHLLGAVGAVLLLKAVVTSGLLHLMGARPGTSAEAGILLASPSETTLIVLGGAQAAQLISADTASFWQTVTAFGLLVTPALAALGKRLGHRVEHASAPAEDVPPAPEGGPRAIVVGFGRVGRLVADLLTTHEQPYVAIDADSDLVSRGQQDGYVVVFGDVARGTALSRLGVEQASAVILTMDEPHGAQRLVKRLRSQHPTLPIIARARDASHAAQLYRAGATHAVPETLESSLQLSESVLVELGVPMGFVIASIHEKRDEMRDKIMHEGGLGAKPKLKSSTLRDRKEKEA